MKEIKPLKPLGEDINSLIKTLEEGVLYGGLGKEKWTDMWNKTMFYEYALRRRTSHQAAHRYIRRFGGYTEPRAYKKHHLMLYNKEGIPLAQYVRDFRQPQHQAFQPSRP